MHLSRSSSYGKAAIATLAATVLLLITSICPVTAAIPPSSPADWTFMVFLAADNNLESAGIKDFLEMAAVGSSAEVNIVVQFDRIAGYDTRYENWTTTKRYLVQQDMVPDAASALADIGEANMGDPDVLGDFVQWAQAEYPAANYGLVFWNHGSGWRENLPPEGLPHKDVCFDDTDGDALSSLNLYQALDELTSGGANPIHLVGFDACLMGMAEVDNQIRSFAQVRVGAEETEPGDGWPYYLVMNDLTGNPTWSAAQLGSDIVDRYYQSYGGDETLSAVDLGEPYGGLNGAVDLFAQALIDYVDTHRAQYAQALYASQRFDEATYIDLYDFASQINSRISEPGINDAANGLMGAVDAAVINEQHGARWPGAHGISIYHPWRQPDPAYSDLQFAQLTRWDEYLYAFLYGSEPAMHVQSIEMGHGELGTRYLVATLVAIVDSAGDPVSEAVVSLDIELPGGRVVNRQAATNLSGWCRVLLWSRQEGTFTATVTEVSKSGWLHDSAADEETSETHIVP